MKTRLAMLVVMAAGMMLGGCTYDQWDRMERWNKKAPGYNDVPLRRFGNYDNRDKAETLSNENLRTWMKLWFDYRDAYQDNWFKRGDYDEEVKALKRRMDVLKTVIEDSAMQLTADGTPLS
ncbi:MAG: hypothetical protein BIFFINMI_01546 [Phycisphaerae bacterium]|nr:hypothetical protein [Phycisphaerae bacterium]